VNKYSIEIAPAGNLEGAADQAIADERARINGAQFRAFGLRRTIDTSLGYFLRRMATHPERIADGNFHDMAKPPIVDLIDHIRLYTRNRKPYVAIFHPYTRLSHELLTALVHWTTEVGLEALVDADSEYYPGVTLRIALYRPGTQFPSADLA
jgi:hypothetical protein